MHTKLQSLLLDLGESQAVEVESHVHSMRRSVEVVSFSSIRSRFQSSTSCCASL